MADTNRPIHLGDNIVLGENYDFSQSYFDLEEPMIASLSEEIETPCNTIKNKLNNYDQFLKIGHLNPCSF